MIDIILNIINFIGFTVVTGCVVWSIRQEGKIKMLENKVKDFEKIETLIHEIDKKLERVITIIEIKGGSK